MCRLGHASSNVQLSALKSDGDILIWCSQRWYVETAGPVTQSAEPSNPVPVRFPTSLLKAEAAIDCREGTSKWNLGLVIHSYVTHDTRQMMHVIMLDDGTELHLRSGDVDDIVVLSQYDDGQQCKDDTEFSECRLLGGHASSQEHNVTTSLDTIHSDFSPTFAGEEITLETEADNSWLSWYNFGECSNETTEAAAQPPGTPSAHPSVNALVGPLPMPTPL